MASLIWAVLLIGFHPLLWNGLLRPGNEPPGYRWLYGLLAIMGLIWGLSSRRSPSRALAVLAAVMLLSVLLVPSIVR